MRAMRALPTLQDPNRFGPWACGIAVRACLDWLKNKSRTQVTGMDLRFVAADQDRSAGERQERLHRLRDEVERLPEDYREAMLLFYHGEMCYRDMADLLGVSTATVNARLTKARMILRERLGTSRTDPWTAKSRSG